MAPVVVLNGLNSERDPDMWSPVVSGGDPTHDDPLAGRVLRFWLWPFGYSDGEFARPLSGTGLETDALQSPEGQNRTQQEQDENLRLLYVGVTRAKSKLVFAHRTGRYAWLNRLPNVDTILDCSQGEGEHPLDDIETTFVVRQFDASMADAYRQVTPGSETWISAQATPASTALIDRYHRPSESPATTPAAEFHVENLPGTSYFPSGATEGSWPGCGDRTMR